MYEQQAKILILTAGEEVVFEGRTDEITESLSEGNDFQREDVEGAFEWLDEKYGDADGRITADVLSMIDNTDTLDGLGTRALFWTAALMMKNGTLNKLPIPYVFRLLPIIQRKTAVHAMKVKSANEKAAAFLESFKEIISRLSESRISEDEALTEIFKAMPERDLIEYKLATNPHFTDVFRVIKQISERCKDEKLKLLTDKVMDEFDLEL
ncbi:MAG: hypothetical protein ACI4I2_03895 [Oscillospiraceae bacterium]